jgi:hypothetical protein
MIRIVALVVLVTAMSDYYAFDRMDPCLRACSRVELPFHSAARFKTGTLESLC